MVDGALSGLDQPLPPVEHHLRADRGAPRRFHRDRLHLHPVPPPGPPCDPGNQRLTSTNSFLIQSLFQPPQGGATLPPAQHGGDMTAWSSGASPGRMRREAFRRWVEAQPNGVRYERIDGKPVAMSPERVVHNRLKRRAWQLLDRAIADQGLPCEALADGITVEIGEDQDYRA